LSRVKGGTRTLKLAMPIRLWRKVKPSRSNMRGFFVF